MSKVLRSVGLALAIVALSVPGGAASASTGDHPSGYRFTPVAFLGDAAPGGGVFTFDFEPSAINNRGEIGFTADLAQTAGGSDIGEGVFVGRRGQIANLARVGNPAPSGGTFDAAELGRIGLNTRGDASFGFSLVPFDPQVPGLNSGVYRFSRRLGTVSALLTPGQPAPGGGTFHGTYFNTSINDRADAVFPGIVPTGSQSLGTGLFLADHQGNVFSVVRPGDPAPRGKVFDSAINGTINDAGDIAFGGHIAGEECVNIGSPLVCGESVYLRTRNDGATVRPGGETTIQSIAHQGSPSPCGGQPYRTAFGPVLNNRGDIVFLGDLTPPPNSAQVTGVFVSSEDGVTRVACPGDPLPGGGTMVSAGAGDATYSINDAGRISFAAAVTIGGNAGSGIYVFSDESKSVVAQTGTVIPGVGTIANVGLGFSGPISAQAGGVINDRGQVLLSATLTDGRVVLLLATPRDDTQPAR